MGIFLGLSAALAWGSADFLARFATHRIGTIRTLFSMQTIGFVLLTLALPRLGGFGHLADGSGWTPWAWGIFVGALNTGAMLALYRSFEVGKLSIVAPISASYPALTVLLSVLTGERLTLARAIGIAATILGVVLASTGAPTRSGPAPPAENSAPRKLSSGAGILWALLAALGFGVIYWLLGVRVVPLVGSAASVWLIRLTSVLLSAGLLLAVRLPLLPPRGKFSVLLLLMSALDTGGYVCNNFGYRFDQISVVSVLASLYGAVTVALAAAFLREKLAWWQWTGIVLIFGGVFFLSR